MRGQEKVCSLIFDIILNTFISLFAKDIIFFILLFRNERNSRQKGSQEKESKGEFDNLPPIEDLKISVPEVLCDPLGEVLILSITPHLPLAQVRLGQCQKL